MQWTRNLMTWTCGVCFICSTAPSKWKWRNFKTFFYSLVEDVFFNHTRYMHSWEVDEFQQLMKTISHSTNCKGLISSETILSIKLMILFACPSEHTAAWIENWSRVVCYRFRGVILNRIYINKMVLQIWSI